MTGTVLAAIDLGNPEHHAAILNRAGMLAEIDGASLSVVTAIPDFGMSIVGSYFDEAAEKVVLERARSGLQEAISAVLGEGGDRKVRHVVRCGKAYEEILATADELNASVIVMGAHRPNFSDYLLGPNAARVARHSTCSVYIVRD